MHIFIWSNFFIYIIAEIYLRSSLSHYLHYDSIGPFVVVIWFCYGLLLNSMTVSIIRCVRRYRIAFWALTH